MKRQLQLTLTVSEPALICTIIKEANRASITEQAWLDLNGEKALAILLGLCAYASPKEAAVWLGIRKTTVLRRVAYGDFPATIQLNSRCLRIPYADLEAFVRSHGIARDLEWERYCKLSGWQQGRSTALMVQAMENPEIPLGEPGAPQVIGRKPKRVPLSPGAHQAYRNHTGLRVASDRRKKPFPENANAIQGPGLPLHEMMGVSEDRARI